MRRFAWKRWFVQLALCMGLVLSWGVTLEGIGWPRIILGWVLVAAIGWNVYGKEVAK